MLTSRRLRLLAPAALLLATLGCLGPYHVGVRSLVPADVRTVKVEMFASSSYRRYLGERLTEAVVKEIESRTPYKVVSSNNADAVLSGRIVSETKNVVVTTRSDDVREAEIRLVVQVGWAGRTTSVDAPRELIDVNGDARLVPEVGHSMALSQQQALQKLAARIVDLMEIDPLPGL